MDKGGVGRPAGSPPIAGGAAIARSRSWWQSPRARRRAFAGYLFLLPWIVGFLGLTAYPVVWSFYLSFNDYAVLYEPSWIGLDNYIEMFTDDELFGVSLRVTTYYTFVAVPLGVIVGYAVALLLNQKVAGLSVWRTMYFIPSIVPAIATAYLWMWMFHPDFGILNGVLKVFGVIPPRWFASREWVIPAFVIMHLWAAGGSLILFLAALQGVPTTLYESAKVDGANAWQRVRNITIPMTSPVILFAFLTGLIGTFQVFVGAYVITDGGPDNSSLFYLLYLYRNGWEYWRMGYAAGLAWILLIILLALTALTLYASKYLVYYELSEKEA